jgi:hypothetical protein
MLKRSADESTLKQFNEIEESKLAAMSPKELAAWQFQQPKDGPHQILASHEWQRRLIAEQVKWMKFSIMIGFVGVIIGALITAWLEPAPRDEYHHSTSRETQNKNVYQITEPSTPVPTPSNAAATQKPNQAPEPTTTAVTDRAAHAPRQP